MKFYRCWVGTKHPATHIPEGATDDTLLQFHCACMGTFAQDPRIKALLDAGEKVTVARAQLIVGMNPGGGPPRNPVVRVGDLEDDDG